MTHKNERDEELKAYLDGRETRRWTSIWSTGHFINWGKCNKNANSHQIWTASHVEMIGDQLTVISWFSIKVANVENKKSHYFLK